MNDKYDKLNDIGIEIGAIKSLTIVVRKLFIESYAADFNDCDKNVILALLVKEIQNLHADYQDLLNYLS